jgi:hypothetical protein
MFVMVVYNHAWSDKFVAVIAFRFASSMFTAGIFEVVS